MPSGWDPPELNVHSSAEATFLAATSYTPSTGKIETQGGDYECIVGVDANGNLGILVCDFGDVDKDNLPALHLTEDQFDEIVADLGQQNPGSATLGYKSLING